MTRALERFEQFFLPASGALNVLPWSVAAAAGGALGVALSLSDTAQRLEWATYDRLMRSVTSHDAPAPGVVLVAIDEPSATELGRPWPWPRAWHAQLVESVEARGRPRDRLGHRVRGPRRGPGRRCRVRARRR